MRSILSTYQLDEDKIYVKPIKHPLSDYEYTIDDAYIYHAKNVLFNRFSLLDYAPSLVFDTVTFDIDGDGIDEVCTLGSGPTSGRFTFVIQAREVGKERNEYAGIYETDFHKLSFEEDSAGKLKVKAFQSSQQEEGRRFDVAVANGLIVLLENGVPLGQ